MNIQDFRQYYISIGDPLIGLWEDLFASQS
jgi:hypothetical protein